MTGLCLHHNNFIFGKPPRYTPVNNYTGY